MSAKALEHLPPDSKPERVAELLECDGAVVIEGIGGGGRLDRVAREMKPWMEATRQGPDDFTGKRTRRTGGLMARSPASHGLVQDPLILGTVSKVLAHAFNYHLHLTQIIAIGPGEKAQPIHRDQ